MAALARIPGFRQDGASPDSDQHPALQPVMSVAGDDTICTDDALAMRALRDRIESGSPAGGMAIGITVRAGQMRDQAAARIADGDRCTQRGDLAAALRHYDRAAALMRRLSAADANEPAFSRDLSVAQNRIAAVLFAQGHWREAADGYRRSIAIMERLAAANPHNGDFQNDLAWCRARLAEIPAAGDGGSERTAS